MFGIPFNLGRVPHVAFDQDRLCEAAERDRAGEKQRTAGNHVLGLPNVGDDFLGGLLRAGADAGKRERRGHQLQELPAPLGIVPLRGLLGKLPVQVLAELERVCQLAEAAPVQASLRAGQT